MSTFTLIISAITAIAGLIVPIAQSSSADKEPTPISSEKQPATEEATPEVTEEATEEVAEEATEAPAEEATEEVAEETTEAPAEDTEAPAEDAAAESAE
ncbi:hypothetical protein [Corynebacterium pelargi]|uniref:Uncharacterized protein n=1 Tax=Corynebacterium pelargi TaxID=1471400 RepID=A0A410WBN1_9CORY|nr:hypothetical protein [Corynebacterium pelargi]QAU53371.1 hypothetical protein CPELA_10640 [Corynebacterium pelargi]GGG72956.1 hypothetical protein GCM10007338_07640 [Corynebacterium pelargi]